MTTQLISSPANPLLKRFRKLKSAKQRGREGATVVEGIAPVWHALDHAHVETLLVSPQLLHSADAGSLVERARGHEVEIAELTAAAFTQIADRENPSGLAAIVRTVERGLADLEVRDDSLFAVALDVASPGNLGTIVRTADAVGGAVVVVGESTDPWHPTCVKASMATVFTTPVARAPAAGAVMAWCRDTGQTVVTTSARATSEHWSVAYDLPAGIFLGSERHGLPPDVVALGDVQVRIPMGGKASSLNLAVAAGILMYEARRP